MVCAPMHAFPEFFIPALRTIFLPSDWLFFHISIVEIMDGGGGRMNPEPMTIINPLKEIGRREKVRNNGNGQ